MPPSIESSTSSGSAEPVTPPFNRNATWSASRTAAAATPDKESTPTATPLSLRKRFASFTRSAGKSASDSLSASSTPSSTTPLSECTQRIEKLDLQKGAAASGTSTPKQGASALHAPSAPASPRPSSAQNEPDVFGTAYASKTDSFEDSPLQRVFKSPTAKPLPGHPGNLTAAQMHALHELTSVLKLDGALQHPESETPSYQETQLLRFLRARNFNVQAARTMYLKAEAWKKEIELDRLVREFRFDERDAVASHGWCMYFHKTDRLGRPVFIQDLGNMDTTGMFRHTTPERVIQNFAVTLELAVRHRYEACTVASARWVDDNMMVVNLAGLGLGTFWAMKGQLQQLLGILDNNFPELSGRVQIINAPYMFSTIWSWVKGWLPVATVEKIDIAGADYHARVFEYVRREDWPKDLGGECECSGEKGCSKSDLGPWDKRLVRTADL
ncbi:related to SEC14-phosphatidylinositol/phosphatidylcholine transfer protein [Sporisorium reilianum f. sp. reilianum]|uniref:Related to SEC14-phosphatidylinositol/phosphatidylcholine transfer protein n=1 Tax=Sporisorium reilianum f. sp. reilianum TaxID=72559 RepID=A0A2N8UGD2_9BASI|nr:related to SEC14-phosphatidylinositol/phosphatidylcholine transfer protein [Sporisorium reilianum f. sp. reilianum]